MRRLKVLDNFNAYYLHYDRYYLVVVFNSLIRQYELYVIYKTNEISYGLKTFAIKKVVLSDDRLLKTSLRVPCL